MRYNFKQKIYYFKLKTRPSLNYSKASLRPPLLMLAFFLILASSYIAPASSYAKSCDDVEFIFARGSGESLNDKSARAWRENIEDALQKSTLRYHFYELGEETYGGYSYPAASVSDSLGGYARLIGAYVGRGEAFDFGRSVAQGVGELQAYIKTITASCPGTKLVLGGYSQGAMILSQTLPLLNSEQIIYVATFGDPKLYLPEGKGLIPPACLNGTRSEYRINVADCRAYEGVLGSYRPYQPEGYEDKLGTWCNAKDIMCSSGANIDDHSAYTSNGFYSEATRRIKTRLKRAFPKAFATETVHPWANVTHNVAILIDTSISMVNYLGGYRKEAKNLAHQVLNDDGKVAIAEFRDLDDPYDPRLLCDFSCDESEITRSLNDLSTGGGGDDPESALSALLYTMNNLDWEAGAAKSIILVTDNEYLLPDRDGTILSQVVQRSIEIDPVNVYVLTNERFQNAYHELVERTGGASFDLNDPTDWQKLNDLVLYRPEALLNATEFFGTINDTFAFDASASNAINNETLRYDWDLDGDGTFEILNGPAMLHKTYHAPFSGNIVVRVTDTHGRSSTMSAKVTVLATLPDFPELHNATFTEISPHTYQIQYQTNAEQVLVSIDDAPIGYINGSTGEFTINDVTARTSLRLVPYTTNVGRGEGITLDFGRETLPNTDNTVTQPSPSLPPLVSQPSHPSSASPAFNMIIPKAPNAGATKNRPSEKYLH